MTTSADFICQIHQRDTKANLLIDLQPGEIGFALDESVAVYKTYEGSFVQFATSATSVTLLTGTGTEGRLARFTSPTAISASIIQESGTDIYVPGNFIATTITAGTLATVSDATIGNNLTVNGATSLGSTLNVTGVIKSNMTGGGPASGLVVSAANPSMALNDSDASVDNRWWDVLASGEQLRYRAINDANSSSNSYMTVDRTGVTIDNVTFPAPIIIASSLNISGTQSNASYIQFTGTTGGTTGWIGRTALGGLVINGITGSSYDLSIRNTNGNDLIRNPAGSSMMEFNGSGGVSAVGPIYLTNTLNVSGVSNFASRLTIGPKSNASYALSLYDYPPLTGTQQYGAIIYGEFNSSATNTATALAVGIATAAGAWTMANAYGIHVQEAFVQNSGITTQYGIKIADQFSGATSYALHTGAGLVRLGDAVTMASTLNVAGAGTMASTLNVSGAASLASTLTVNGLTTAKASLKVEGEYLALPQLISDPSSPAYGWMYWNTNSNHLRLYTPFAGGSWVDLY